MCVKGFVNIKCIQIFDLLKKIVSLVSNTLSLIFVADSF